MLKADHMTVKGVGGKGEGEERLRQRGGRPGWRGARCARRASIPPYPPPIHPTPQDDRDSLVTRKLVYSLGITMDENECTCCAMRYSKVPAPPVTAIARASRRRPVMPYATNVQIWRGSGRAVAG